jgi:rhodanese-related sulfurtransferase
MQQMTAQELAEQIKAGAAPIIIDVCEPYEFQHARIEGAVLKPPGEIYHYARELDKEPAYVVMCHTGGRSYQTATMLERMGFTQVANLLGSIDNWTMRIDPTVPRYQACARVTDDLSLRHARTFLSGIHLKPDTQL